MTPARRRALRGEQVRLRAFRREDLPRVIAWRRDEELRRGALWSDAPFGPREAQRWLRAVSDGADASRVTLAIELLAGAQGVEFLAPLQPGIGARATREFVRGLSPRLQDDRPLAADIERVAAAIRDGSLAAAVEAEVGELL
jgi:hypothetical protein